MTLCSRNEFKGLYLVGLRIDCMQLGKSLEEELLGAANAKIYELGLANAIPRTKRSLGLYLASVHQVLVLILVLHPQFWSWTRSWCKSLVSLAITYFHLLNYHILLFVDLDFRSKLVTFWVNIDVNIVKANQMTKNLQTMFL